MKNLTLKSRLEKRYQGSKSSKGYQIVKDLIEGTNKTFTVYNNRIRPCYTSGRGRFTSNQDHTNDVTRLLDLLGVKYVTGNDAPRGSATGNFIVIKTKLTK